MKNKKMVGYFVADQESDFYQSPTYLKMFQIVQTHPQKVMVKEKQTRNGLRLLITFEGILSVNQALKALKPFEE